MARTNSIENIQKTLDLAGQELRILHQISQSISSTLDLDQVLRQIIDLVVDVTHGDSCLVYLLDETGENLVLRASKNPHPRLIGKIENPTKRDLVIDTFAKALDIELAGAETASVVYGRSWIGTSPRQR